ncbi:MAG TPA: bifunctional phosphoribosylaminoimidazolecarboxamide formyltransferase/IMP cyclohydrolase PurH, partial [Acidimicrobiales bacterium]|nr:bifunctional phosphoribosylaminoimidazolecarboxamide formyltransferase/IMP cyclohydrolase PurH [Acidimicrobiales bacterium]
VAWFDNSDPQSANRGFPETIHLTLQRAQDLRYGENPHQFGARYRNAEVPTWWDTLIQHSGMELSYLNLFDAEAAWRLVNEVGEAFGEEAPASVVIVKHANPCGVAISSDLSDAYQKAFDCDPISAFGGIVALSGTVTDDVAEVIVQCAQADVIIAPSYHPGALAKLIGKRKNTRILEAQSPSKVPIDLRRLDSGFLVQVPDSLQKGPDQWKAVTKVQPDASIMRDLELAWLVCARTSSNAIVIVKDGRAVGIGAGQQNRLDSARIAIGKAGDKVHGAAAASDAFFPFRDGLDALASSGVGAVIQPGGSVRDEEVIAAADEAGLAMVLTGERHFRH